MTRITSKQHRAVTSTVTPSARIHQQLMADDADELRQPSLLQVGAKSRASLPVPGFWPMTSVSSTPRRSSTGDSISVDVRHDGADA
jgi:hypothetical protein